MSEEELKIWFLNMFNSCYAVKHDDYPDSIFYFYDEQFIRRKKLSKINNQELLLPNNVSGVCLFIQEDNILFNCSYHEIWESIYNNTEYGYSDVQNLITIFFKDNYEFNLLTPTYFAGESEKFFVDMTKFSVITNK